MTTTTEIARDEMMAAVVAALEPFSVDMRWQGKDKPNPPNGELPYTFTAITTALEGQASLTGAFSKTRWNSQGTIMVQCYAPLNLGSIDAAMAMALAVKRYFRKLSTPGGVWFRNASAKEIGVSTSWYQVNFTATFTFDEIQ